MLAWYHMVPFREYSHHTTGSTYIQGHVYYRGRVNKAARDWLDALTAPEPGEQVPRTTTRGTMLARIVVEIRAADIAVELKP
jgi:hypothetical protein